VVAGDAVDAGAEVAGGGGVEVEEGFGAVVAAFEDVEDEVAAGEAEVGFEAVDGFEGAEGAFGGFAFGLDVGVGEVDEAEVAGAAARAGEAAAERAAAVAAKKSRRFMTFSIGDAGDRRIGGW
jgi:hypothetical protein